MIFFEQYIPILCAVIISALVVALLIPRILLIALKKKKLDSIDSRKINTGRTCRLGGVSFLIAIVISVFTVFLSLSYLGLFAYDVSFKQLYLFLSILLIYLVGFYDDLCGVRYKNKFIFQIISSLLVILSGVYLHSFHGSFMLYDIPDYISYPFTVLLIVFVINAMNLIDGLDGLAASLAIMALLVYGLLLLFCGDYIYALLSFSTLGALLMFLYFNLFKVRNRITTKVIMGDSGALVIGLILSVLAVKLWNIVSSGSISLKLAESCHLLSFTMLIIPCFDVLRVMLYRLKKNKPLFLPDKNHFHHKLLDLGFSHRKTLCCILLVNLLFISVNSCCIAIISVPYVVVIDLFLWTVLHVVISRNIRIRKSE